MVETSKANDFREVFPVAVEAGLKEILGECPMNVILSRFPDIATSPEKFEQVLMEIFGEGAKALQRYVLAHVPQQSLSLKYRK